MKNILLIIIILVLVVMSFGCAVHTKQYELIAISDNLQVEGSFFLGCGSINGEWEYTFYCRINGAIMMKSCPIDRGLIYEGDYKDPYVVIDWQTNSYREEEIVKAKFYVPYNSVNTNYNLDLQK